MEPPAKVSDHIPAGGLRGRPSHPVGAGARGRIVAAAVGAGLALSIFMARLVYVAVTAETFRNDFRLYLGGALVGLHHGFAHLYDADLQRQAIEALPGGGNYQPFVSPPLAAWLALPLTGVPFRAGVLLWTALLVLCLLLTWWLLAPGELPAKVAHLLLAAGFLPLAFAVSVGQLAPLIALAVAVAYVLLRAGRPEVAGVALVLVWLKPQDALLVAPALLVAGRWRCFAAWAASSAVLGVASLVALGPHGVAAYSAALTAAGQWDLMRRFALPGQALWGPVAPLVSVAVAIATLVLARRQRRHLGLVMAVGLSGSLLVSPYLGVQDLSLLIPAAWLAWREGAPTWHLALAAAVYTVLELSLVLGPVPVLLAEISWLSSLWFVARSPGAGPSIPRRDTSPGPVTLSPQSGARTTR